MNSAVVGWGERGWKGAGSGWVRLLFGTCTPVIGRKTHGHHRRARGAYTTLVQL